MFGPNITGWFTLGQNSGHVPKVDGTLFYITNKSVTAASSNNANHAMEVTMDPSRESDVFGNADTIQPSSVRVLPCIKI